MTTKPLLPMRATGEDSGWKRALRRLAGSAARVHHYRYLRARMLQEALQRADERRGCGPG